MASPIETETVDDSPQARNAIEVRALVVDDEPLVRRTVSRWLTSAGFSVTEAENGELALRAAREERFDIVVSDVRMPLMSGLTLLTLLTAEQPDLPVILMSGSPDVYAADVLALGARDFLLKPVEQDVLLRCIREALQ